MLQKKAIIISCFDWYENRLKYVERKLQSMGYDVKFLFSDFNHTKKIYQRNYVKDNVCYIHVRGYQKNISIQRLISHYYFAINVCKNVKDENPDLVYCLIPPNSLVRKIVYLRKKIRFKLVFDVIDMWPESFPKMRKFNFFFTSWKFLRDKFINMADEVVVECEYYKRFLKTVERNKFVIFRLVKDEIEEEIIYEPYKEMICLGYLGSINSIIDIDRICNIVSLLCKKYSVLVRVVGDGEQREKFLKKLRQAGANVKFFGKQYEEKELYRIFGNCHLGINIYKANLNIGLTMKSVNYFQMNLPILNSILGDTWEVVDKYQVGINICDNDEMNCETIVKYVKNIAIFRKNVKSLFEREFSSQNINERIAFLENV